MASKIQVVRQPGIASPIRWKVETVRTAVDRHEIGDFCYSAALARDFMRDDRIQGCTVDRCNALTSADGGRFALAPVEGTWGRRSKTFTNDAETWWPRVVTSAWQKGVLTDSIHVGFHLSQIHWERTKSRWNIARLERWRPENVRWSEMDQAYVASTQDAGFVRIDPDDPRWFLYTPGGDESWMTGSVRYLGMPYMMRSWNFRDWARYNERHGQPIIKVVEPMGQTDEDRKSRFYNQLRNMGSRGIIGVSRGEAERGDDYDVELMEATARSYDSFDKFMVRLDNAIAIGLKGQNLTTQVESGAKASTGWHMRVRKDYAETDAATLGEAQRAQLLVRWGRFNVSGWNDEIASYPTWELSIPEDAESVAKALLSGAQSVVQFQKTRHPIDWEAYYAKLGIKIEEGKPFPEPPEPVAPTPPKKNGEADPAAVAA